MRPGDKKYSKRNGKQYLCAVNFNPFIWNDGKFRYANKDSQLYKEFTHKIDSLVDDRCDMISINNDNTNMDFIINYAKYNAYVANNVGEDETLGNPNKYLQRYLSYGYVPLIFLPTPRISEWEVLLLSRLDAIHQQLGIEYIRTPSNSFNGSKKLSTYDYWMHKLDLSKLLNCPPEKVRMVDAIQEVFKLDA